MIKKISDKDKKDWNKFINSNEKIPNKDFNHQEKKSFKIRSIDLHGYTLDEANKKIENFINKAFTENVNKLIVVTGKVKFQRMVYFICVICFHYIGNCATFGK